MLRRLLNVAAVPSLLVALLLMVADQTEAPLRPWWIGDPNSNGWAAGLHLGRVMVVKVSGGALLSVPINVSFQSLAIPFALFPLAWFVVVVRRERRARHTKGFPVEVSHAQAIQPTANRGTEATGEDAEETASDELDYQGRITRANRRA